MKATNWGMDSFYNNKRYKIEEIKIKRYVDDYRVTLTSTDISRPFLCIEEISEEDLRKLYYQIHLLLFEDIELEDLTKFQAKE